MAIFYQVGKGTAVLSFFLCVSSTLVPDCTACFIAEHQVTFLLKSVFWRDCMPYICTILGWQVNGIGVALIVSPLERCSLICYMWLSQDQSLLSSDCWRAFSHYICAEIYYQVRETRITLPLMLLCLTVLAFVFHLRFSFVAIGTIPSELGLVTGLRRLHLSENWFTGWCLWRTLGSLPFIWAWLVIAVCVWPSQDPLHLVSDSSLDSMNWLWIGLAWQVFEK